MEAKTPMAKDYDSQSSTQLAASLLNVGRVTKALQLYKQEAVVHIADFGSATGLNTMKAFTPALWKLREDSSAEVVVHHVDIPSNHWETVFDNYWNSEFSYREVSGVYAEAAGGSLYRRMFPASFLSLVYSSSTLHWLSELLPVTAETDLGELNRALKELSHRDLHTFLSHRYEELRTGGRIITRAPISNFYKDLIAYLTDSPALQSLPKHFFLSLTTRVRFRSLTDYQAVLESFPEKYRVLELSEEVREHPVFAVLRESGDREKFTEKMLSEVFAVASSTLQTVTQGLGVEAGALAEVFKAGVRQFFLTTEDRGVHHDAVLVLEKV